MPFLTYWGRWIWKGRRTFNPRWLLINTVEKDGYFPTHTHNTKEMTITVNLLTSFWFKAHLSIGPHKYYFKMIKSNLVLKWEKSRYFGSTRCNSLSIASAALVCSRKTRIETRSLLETSKICRVSFPRVKTPLVRGKSLYPENIFSL